MNEECKVCGNVKREDGSCPVCNGSELAPSHIGRGGEGAGLAVEVDPLEMFKKFLNEFGLKQQRMAEGSISRGEGSRGYHRAMRDVYDEMERLGL